MKVLYEEKHILCPCLILHHLLPHLTALFQIFTLAKPLSFTGYLFFFLWVSRPFHTHFIFVIVHTFLKWKCERVKFIHSLQKILNSDEINTRCVKRSTYLQKSWKDKGFEMCKSDIKQRDLGTKYEALIKEKRIFFFPENISHKTEKISSPQRNVCEIIILDH